MTHSNLRPEKASRPPLAGPLRSALVGMILGVDATALCLALATTCFSGALVAGLGLATALFLFGSVLATRALFHFGGFRQPLAISQDTTVSILAPAVILAASAVSGPVEAKVATALAVIGVSALASGLAFWTIGALGLGRLVRMFPYPVAAGFLAGSGYLLVYTAISILTGHTDLSGIIGALGEPLVQLRLLPAIVMALALVFAVRIWAGSMAVLAIVFLATLGFYVALSALGIAPTEAVDLGLLPRIDTQTRNIASPAMFGLIEWQAVLATAPVVAAVVLLNVLGLLLNTSGVELATRDDVDENRELRVTGVANLLIGCFGGLTSFLQSGATIMSAKLGVQPNAMIAGHNVVLLVACGIAPVMVAWVPGFVPAALLMFIGLSMLEDWLLGTMRKLKLADWLIVVSIVVVTALLGILPAIAVGLALALLLFASAAVRLPVIRHHTSAVKRRSIRDRNTLDAEALLREGHRIRIVHLQGSLFFGSVEQLSERMRSQVQSLPGIHAIIFDFSSVVSFDSSACAALEKLVHAMTSHGISAHVAAVPPRVLTVFEKWGLPLVREPGKPSTAAFRHWPTLDDALEHCETALLADSQHGSPLADFAETLRELGRNHKRTPDLLAVMEKRQVKRGEVLITAAQQVGDVYFVVSGQLGVHLPNSDGPPVRVRSLGAGSIVGEVAYLTSEPRNADVVCEEDATVLLLPEATLQRLEREDRDLAALLMSIFSRSLAAKLVQSNALLTYAASLASNGKRVLD